MQTGFLGLVRRLGSTGHGRLASGLGFGKPTGFVALACRGPHAVGVLLGTVAAVRVVIHTAGLNGGCDGAGSEDNILRMVDSYRQQDAQDSSTIGYVDSHVRRV